MPPLLSILIPTFNYPRGVTRILALLRECLSDEVEVIISDDSPGDSVARAVAPFTSATERITYVHNRPPLGAAANWNRLLGTARGEYCLLLHHDEFPTSPTFIDDVARELRRHSFPDVLVLTCLLVREDTGHNAVHVPGWLRSAVLRRAPGYLLIRNVIGPPSVIVAKRSLYPAFDQSLSWLIDVDAYRRLKALASSIHFAHNIDVASITGRATSISASLKPTISHLRSRELAYLASKSAHSTAIGLLTGPGVSARGLRLIEIGGWSLVRLLTRSWASMAPSRYSKKAMQDLLARGGAH